MKNTEKAVKDDSIAYRKGSFEARMNDLLPEGESFTVKAFELWREAEGGWSVNDGWTIARAVDRQDAISALRGRWEIFKLNYLPKARVSDISDIGYEDDLCRLEVECTAFADVSIDQD